MGKVTASVTVNHPIDRVFDVATRVPDLPRWMPEVVAAELLDPALATGARVRLTLSAATANAVITGTVEELAAPFVLRIAGAGGPLTVGVVTILEAIGSTATRAQLEVEIGVPPFLGFIGQEAERRINAELPAALDRLNALLDAERDRPTLGA